MILQSASRVRVREKRSYVAITACPSNGLLNTSDQTSWNGGEVKTGCGRGLRDCSSDQSRADEESVRKMHLE